MGLMQNFLDVEVLQTNHGILLHQTAYLKSILAKYASTTSAHISVHDAVRLSKDSKIPSKHQTAFQALVGKLHYVTKIQPNLGFSASLTSRYRYIHGPQQLHHDTVLHIVKYLRKRPSLRLWFPTGEENQLYGFSDVDYAGNLDDRTSTSVYLFYFGKTPIS